MAVGVPTELGTEKISKLLRQYAVPAIIAMTASSIYNMVDSIFIGQGVGALAISGLALTFPLMNLGVAFGSLVGVGASTTISVLLGQKNYDNAQKVLGNVVVMNLIIGVAYMIGILLYLDEILYFFGASDQTIGYAKDYMEIILYGNCITHMYFGLNAVIRSSGFPRFSMNATILTVILNTILDPLFIYVFDWGIRGAAIATILSQAVSLAWQLYKLSDKRNVVHFSKGIYKLKKRIVTDIVSIGMAPFLMNAASCLIVILINKSLKEYGGDLSIGAYGIVNRIVFIFIMIVMGLNQGMQPIAGFNFGAKNYNRLITVLKLTLFCATCITTLGFIIGEFFPRLIVRIFTTDEILIEKAVKGMRLICIFLPLVGMQMVTSNYFQSIGKASKAIFLSLTRQLLFLLPFLLILPNFLGINGVWLSMPFSDLAACIVAGFLLYNEMKKYKSYDNQK